MNNNDDTMINKLMEEAERKIKNIHTNAALQIKKGVTNANDQLKIQNNLNKMIGYHNKLLVAIKNKYSPRKQNEYRKKISDLQTKLGSKNKNIINNTITASKVLNNTKKNIKKILNDSPKYQQAKQFLKQNTIATPDTKIALKIMNDKLAKIQNSDALKKTKEVLNKRLDTISKKLEKVTELSTKTLDNIKNDSQKSLYEISRLSKETIKDILYKVKLDLPKLIPNRNSLTGPQGKPGTPGTPGPAGVPGPVGRTGQQGVPGLAGQPGERGPKGDIGRKGDRGERGAKGDRGDALTWDLLSAPQKALLKGKKGDKGDKGDRGESLKFFNLTNKEKGELIGDRGPTGPEGPRGEKGSKGDPLKYSDLSPDQIRTLRGPMGDRGKQGEKGDRGYIGPRGPIGERGVAGPRGPAGKDAAINSLMVDTDEIRIRSKDKGVLINKNDNGLNLYAGNNITNDPQILLGRELLIRNKNKTVFSADGKEVKIGDGNPLIFNGTINKLTPKVLETSTIKLGNNKKIYLSNMDNNNYIQSNDNTTEFVGHHNTGWKFIRNKDGKLTEVVNIKNNLNGTPDVIVNGNFKVKGKTNFDDLNVSKYNLKDKVSTGSFTIDKGIVKVQAPQGFQIADSDTKYKFLELTYNGKAKRGTLDLQNSTLEMNKVFKIKTANDMIYIQNFFDENILDIPISREAKLKSTSITTSSTYPGASYVNCIQGHLKSVCSTSKKNGVREFVTLKLPQRKIISNIRIYNRTDANMEKMKGVEVTVNDTNGKETFKTTLESVSDFYNLAINAYGKTINLKHTRPNTEIGIRNIKIFTRNLI